MNYSPMQDLKEFHDKFDKDGPARKERMLHTELHEKRAKLIQEEYYEVQDALSLYMKYQARKNLWEMAPAFDKTLANSREELAKELADLLYVVYGTAEELGIPLEEVFAKVHESNMSKVWDDGTVHYNEFGKVLKPNTYSPPDLSFIHEHRV
jgi:predicted HAD superfamily Cof-like phosphohydrolase